MPDYSQQLNRNRAREKEIKIKKEAKNPENQTPSNITDTEWMIVFSIAIFADLLGPAGFIPASILLLWYVFKFHRFPTKRFIGAGFFEAISLGFLPGWTGFMVVTFFKEKGYLPKWISKLVGTKT